LSFQQFDRATDRAEAPASVTDGAAIPSARQLGSSTDSRSEPIKDYDEDGSVQGRFNAWHFAYNLAIDRPLVGGGFGAFTPALFQIYAPNPENYHDAHSIYFRVLGEHGFVGLFLFLILGFTTWRSASQLERLTNHLPSLQWVSDLASMSRIALAAFAAGGITAGFAYFDFPYEIVAIIVVCKLLYREALHPTGDAPAAEVMASILPGQASA
jgi:probable O-glycosylation ligase (exosortase A-associated)